MQVMLLEQQNKKRLLMAREEQDGLWYDKKKKTTNENSSSYCIALSKGATNRPKGSYALQDYQMHVMLLEEEQNNKKRLLMARQERDWYVKNRRLSIARQGQDLNILKSANILMHEQI
jgi:hypothetical protein